MGTIATNIQGLAWDVQSAFNNVASGFQSSVDGIIGTAGATIGGIISGDVVGININQVPNMQNAIREYVNNINQHLATVNQFATTENAFKGDYAVAVTQFVQAVCTACENYVSQLLQFSDKLGHIAEKYQEHDQELKSNIGTQATNMESAYTKYTEGSN